MALALVVLCVTAPRVGAQSQSVAVPAIRSQGDARFGKPPTRTGSLSEVIAEIATIGKRGTWRVDKRWEIIINSLAASEVPVVLDAVAKLPPSDARETLRGALYSRWAEMDPKAAMERLAKKIDPVLARNCLQAVFQGWAHANAPEVLAWAEQLPPGDVKLMAYLAATPYTSANQEKNASVAGSTASAATPDPRAALASAARIANQDERVNAYKSIAKEWAASDPTAAARWAAELLNPNERELLVQLTASTWARTDAKAAATFLVARPEVQGHVLGQVVTEWAWRNLPAVVRWTRELGDNNRRSLVIATVMPLLVVRAPDDALDLLMRMPFENHEFMVTGGNAIARWAETDPDRIFIFLDKLPRTAVARLLVPETLKLVYRATPERLLAFIRELPVEMRRSSYTSIVTAAAETDSAVARKLLSGITDPDDANAIRQTLLQRVVGKNVKLALEIFDELPPGRPQAEALQWIVEQWSRNDPKAALVWLRNQPASPMTQNSLQTILRRIAETDPQSALAELSSLPGSPLRRSLTAEFVASWAARDFAAAQAYMQALPDEDWREGALLAMASRVGSTNPVRGLELLVGSKQSPERASSVQQIASSWAQKDAAAAVRWAEAQTNAVVREEVLLAALFPVAQASPAKAATLVERMTVPQNAERAVATVAQVWAPFDPIAAANWAAERPTSSLREKALNAVLGHWSRNDFAAALAWVTALPPNDVPDSVWANLVQSAFPRRASEGVALVTRVRDEKVRNEMLVNTVSYWMRIDSAAAEAWLAKSTVPPELVEKVRQSQRPK